ncbi:MAG: transposase [Armatimonadetes bacterium]|nr:transposase [Armatimonadota bacterium]
MMTFDILMNTDKCAEIIRQVRWVTGLLCPRCKSHTTREVGTRSDGIRQYYCNSCRREFSDITDTIFEGSYLFKAHCFPYSLVKDQIDSYTTKDQVVA